MKLLLVQSTTYVPTHGGANKANRNLWEQLAERGHDCRVVAPAVPLDEPHRLAQYKADLAAWEIVPKAEQEDVTVFQYRGVIVHAVTTPARLRTYASETIGTFQPDWVLVSSEDPAQYLVEGVIEACPDRTVYLAHTLLPLPFGPLCFLQSQSKTKLLRRAAGIITVSRFMQSYIREWGNLESTVLGFPVYGDEPHPQFDNRDSGYVMMINPCDYKGLLIFAALAQQLPDVPFAGVPTWGTTQADRAALAQLENVRLLPKTNDIREILAQNAHPARAVVVGRSVWTGCRRGDAVRDSGTRRRCRGAARSKAGG